MISYRPISIQTTGNYDNQNTWPLATPEVVKYAVNSDNLSSSWDEGTADSTPMKEHHFLRQASHLIKVSKAKNRIQQNKKHTLKSVNFKSTDDP